MSHSPLPWEVRGDQVWSALTDDFPPRRVQVAEVTDNLFRDPQANAEYIVRACNSYPKLVQALKEARSLCQFVVARNPQYGPNVIVLHHVDEALQLAGEPQEVTK